MYDKIHYNKKIKKEINKERNITKFPIQKLPYVVMYFDLYEYWIQVCQIC